MSSSMRNAIQRRNHKERAQPLERQKWGLLEKNKDYKLRAADHREKRKRLKILREKAADRNPDEFHFGMMSSRTVDGVKVGERGNKALGQEVVMLLKSQDAGYLRTVLQKTRVERKKLESSLIINTDLEEGGSTVLGKRGKKGEKKIFVESVEEQKEFAKSRRKDDVDTDDEEDSENCIPKGDDFEEFSDEESGSEASEEETATPSHRKSQLNMLEALRKREEELVIATRELELQRAKMSNSIGGTNKNGVKFKIRERKR